MTSRRLTTDDRGHAAFVVATLAFILWLAWDSWRASAQTENLMLIFPMAAVALVVGAVILVGILRRAGPRDDAPGAVDLRIPAFMLAVCGYVGGLIVTGFDLATFLFVAVSLVILGERRAWVILIYSAAVAAFAVYGLREMITVPVPTLLFAAG